MQKATNYIKFLKIFLILAFFLTSSCLSRYQEHGYIFESIEKDEIETDLSSKNQVFAIMGSPTITVDDENGENWVYFSENVRNLLFFKPKVIKREIFVVKFDENDIVNEFATYSLNDQRDIDFDGDFTNSSNKKPGFFKSLFGNIGQVTPQ